MLCSANTLLAGTSELRPFPQPFWAQCVEQTFKKKALYPRELSTGSSDYHVRYDVGPSVATQKAEKKRIHFEMEFDGDEIEDVDPDASDDD
jgi:hypothetical protein